jgi:hypothetical protein
MAASVHVQDFYSSHAASLGALHILVYI